MRREFLAIAKDGKLYSFIRALQQANISCRRQRFQGNCYHFRFFAKHEKQVRAFAAQYGVRLELTPRNNLPQILYRYRLRFGIPLGLLGMGCLLFYGSNIVLTIEVVGNIDATQTEILAALEEQGVTRGSWIPAIDFTACEHALRANVAELAWVGIRHTGNRLVIEVTEVEQEVEQLETRIPCNIVASQDAQITGVSIYCGQLMPMVGDAVQKGELLVSGVVMDEKGHIAVRHAMGSVVGIYTQEQTFTCDYVQQVRSVTGEVYERKYLDLFSHLFTLGNAEEPYAESVKTTKYTWFSLFGAELPIGIYREIYREYRTHLLTFTPEEAKQNLTEQLDRYMENFLSDTEVLDKKITVHETETSLTWTVEFTVEGEIGEVKELYLQD